MQYRMQLWSQGGLLFGRTTSLSYTTIHNSKNLIKSMIFSSDTHALGLHMEEEISSHTLPRQGYSLISVSFEENRVIVSSWSSCVANNVTHKQQHNKTRHEASNPQRCFNTNRVLLSQVTRDINTKPTRPT